VELERHRKMDTQFTGQHVIEHIKNVKPDAVVVDACGIGGAVVDYCERSSMRFLRSTDRQRPTTHGNMAIGAPKCGPRESFGWRQVRRFQTMIAWPNRSPGRISTAGKDNQATAR
jgi:hypothetical protein